MTGEDPASTEGVDNDDTQSAALSVPAGIGDLLRTYSSLQRNLARIDLSAIRFTRSVAVKPIDLAPLAAAQRAAAENVRRSIDFSGIEFAFGKLPRALHTTATSGIREWSQALVRSFDVEALRIANQQMAASLGRLIKVPGIAIDSPYPKFDQSALLRSFDLGVKIPSLGEFFGELAKLGKLIEGFDKWKPKNLAGISDLDAVGRISLDEGLPLAWVPRQEIVEQLIEADGPEARLRLLEARLTDVVEDCRQELSEIECEWATECLSAIAALEAGYEGPAQSHASNIIDSIVLRALSGEKRPRTAAATIAQLDYEDLPIRVFVEAVTLRPLYLAFSEWWEGDPIPPHFGRHVTSHAVGKPGVFARSHALVAVMLATSLTLQFWDDPEAELSPRAVS